MIEKFTVSRDDSIYEAWPDVALTRSTRLVCAFTECIHHLDRTYSRIMVADSVDRGRTWSAKRPVTEATRGSTNWNGPRIVRLNDERLVVIVEKVSGNGRRRGRTHLVFSEDDGATWGEPVATPAIGIVPDKLLEMAGGRWLLSSHEEEAGFGYLVQRLWYSDDQGVSWSEPVVVGRQEGLNLCEASILPVDDVLVAFMRENSMLGRPCYKAISRDSGASWGEPIGFPLPGCHRPVAGWLREGPVLITYRLHQGGKYGWGKRTQNFFVAIADRESVLAPSYTEANTRIMPLDYDRSPVSDTGYSGWVQFDDGEIYIVNYIVDDAPNGQIRGYSLRLEDFTLTP